MDGGLVPIDFAKNAEAYGCKTYSVRNEEELRAAILDAEKQTVSTLIDIKVLPKTMTEGYESWWRAGVAEISNNPKGKAAYENMKKNIEKARKY